MSVSINNESKNSLTITNEVKKVIINAYDDPQLFYDDGITFYDGSHGVFIILENKNTLTISNEAKN